ncbi:MAG: hypothetical protein A3F17_08075 [Gammaproteobacteria bacterium RIFCSPHIGHO2_12_FULL_41_15]|nr:MAG: hypothetical protein A3F17_08075 [Gammaproteobacteria bacterium RIFCSPHIGHO2_12_FULL_41_15]
MSYILNDDEINAVTSVIKDGSLDRYIKGGNSISSRFEKNFSNLIGVNYSLALSSGTAALICALVGAGIKPGDHVIIPAYTYIATALAVLAVKAIPIITDIDESLTIDSNDILRKLTGATKAIIPVHMNGLPCNMDKIINIAQNNNLLIIEDVAQACGGTYQGHRLGSLGDIGAFSFNHYKIITCGEGGALTTNNQEMFEKAIAYHHGGHIFESNVKNFNAHGIIGVNFRISEISSAMLEVQLTRLDTIISQLREEKKSISSKLLRLNNPFSLAPCRDEKGECARVIFFQFKDNIVASEFVRRATEKGVDLWLADTKGHVYNDWIPILKSHKEFVYENLKVNNLDQVEENLYVVARKSLEILQSSVGMNIEINKTHNMLDNLIKKFYHLSMEFNSYV